LPSKIRLDETRQNGAAEEAARQHSVASDVTVRSEQPLAQQRQQEADDLGGNIQQSAGDHLRLWIRQFCGEFKADRKIARHEESSYIIQSQVFISGSSWKYP